MIGLGKIRASRLWAKIRDIYKILYTRQVENLKRRLGPKRVSWWTENPKGRSRKKIGIKAYDYVPSDHLQLDLLQMLKVQMVQDQFNQLLLTAKDGMFEDIGAIAKLEPDEITSTWIYIYICFHFVLLHFTTTSSY